MPDAPVLGADARRSSSTTAPSAPASAARSCTRACAPSRPPAGVARRRRRRARWSPAVAPSRGARRAPAAPAPAPAARRSGPAAASVFGPQPRSYTFKVNRKEQRAALRSALSLHAERGSIAILDAAAFSAPKTSQAFDLLDDWGQDGSTLVVLDARGVGRRAVVSQPQARRRADRRRTSAWPTCSAPPRCSSPRRARRADRARRQAGRAQRGGGDA